MDSMNIEVFVLLCLSVKVNKDSCFVCKSEHCKNALLDSTLVLLTRRCTPTPMFLFILVN